MAAALSRHVQLEELILDGNAIGEVGAQALAAAFKSTRHLLKIGLTDNAYISDAGCTALAAALRFLPRLEELHLAYNRISDAGVKALADALPSVPGLLVLDLESNVVTAAGMTFLSAALQASAVPRLRQLRLGHNRIGDSGAVSLARALPYLPELMKLTVHGPKVGPTGPTGIAAVASAVRHYTPKLIVLFFGDYGRRDDNNCWMAWDTSAAVIAARSMPHLSNLKVIEFDGGVPLFERRIWRLLSFFVGRADGMQWDLVRKMVQAVVALAHNVPIPFPLPGPRNYSDFHSDGYYLRLKDSDDDEAGEQVCGQVGYLHPGLFCADTAEVHSARLQCLQAWLEEYSWLRRNHIVAFYETAAQQRRDAAAAPARAAAAALTALADAHDGVAAGCSALARAGAAAAAAGDALDILVARARLEALRKSVADASAAADVFDAQIAAAGDTNSAMVQTELITQVRNRSQV